MRSLKLQHPQQRYHHGKPSEATIYAGMIGIGCTIGLRRMMRISRAVLPRRNWSMR
jgi:hypothetical protein